MAGSTRGWTLLSSAVLVMVLLSSIAAAAQSGGEPGRGGEGPNPLKNVYFGEQHLHTVNSPDAFSFGTRNTPDDAYNFCKGEAIKKSTTGEMIQKATPRWSTYDAKKLGMEPLPDVPATIQERAWTSPI